jgi:type III restriction enzyme
MDEVRAYAQNHNLGFFIPFVYEAEQGRYYPDFLAKMDDGRGMEDLLNVVVGAKVPEAAERWVAAVNAEGTFGRWAFVAVDEPRAAPGAIRRLLSRVRS